MKLFYFNIITIITTTVIIYIWIQEEVHVQEIF